MSSPDFPGFYGVGKTGNEKSAFWEMRTCSLISQEMRNANHLIFRK
jgi:hypothetical protein